MDVGLDAIHYNPRGGVAEHWAVVQSRAQSVSGSCVSFVLVARYMRQGYSHICASALQGVVV